MHICLESSMAPSKLQNIYDEDGGLFTINLGPPYPRPWLRKAQHLPDLHGRNHTRRPTHVFPGGRTVALAVMVTTVLFVLLPTHHPATLYRSPMPTHISPLEMKTGTPLLTSINLSALSSCIIATSVTFLASQLISRVLELQVRLPFFPKFTGSFFFPFRI